MNELNIHPKAVVGIVNWQGQILVGKKEKRTGDILSEKWHIPGGKIENQETPEYAVKREIKEETGLQVKVKQLIDIYLVPNSFDENGKQYGVWWYELEPKSPSLKASSDLTKAKWVAKEKVRQTVDLEAITTWPNKVKEYFQ